MRQKTEKLFGSLSLLEVHLDLFGQCTIYIEAKVTLCDTLHMFDSFGFQHNLFLSHESYAHLLSDILSRHKSHMNKKYSSLVVFNADKHKRNHFIRSIHTSIQTHSNHDTLTISNTLVPFSHLLGSWLFS